MILRGERCAIGFPRLLVIALAALLLAGSILLAVLELERRRRLAATAGETFDAFPIAMSAEELTDKYRGATEFAQLLADVRAHYDRLRNRFLSLAHTRKARLIEFDASGHEVAIMEITDRVQFEDEKEHKEQIQRRQLLGKPFPFDPDTLKAEHPNRKAVHPFSGDTPEGLYRYTLEGVEEVQGRPALRIHFDPTKPIERAFQGSAWIDPGTHEPIRLRGLLAKTPLLVDRFEMRVDYGLSENGHNQLRHVWIDVAGGFALVSRHYRIETELTDYRERAK